MDASEIFASASKMILKEEFDKFPLFKRLLTLDQIPNKIFIKGNLPEFKEDELGRLSPRILTVVGSRKYSSYGKDAVNFLIESLKGQNVVILSGLALGVDSLSHKAALENNLITFSMPGSGLSPDAIYPRTHAPLALQILEKGGVLLSELEDKTTAANWTFPSRNRIVAALADAVLIIEAEEASGTLITGRLALELGKDIGVVPGSIFSPTSKGCNELIKSGASPITEVRDIFDLLYLSHNEIDETNTNAISSLDESEQKLYELLSEPRNKDELLILSEFDMNDFMTAITNLELKGFIHESFGELRRVV